MRVYIRTVVPDLERMLGPSWLWRSRPEEVVEEVREDRLG